MANERIEAALAQLQTAQAESATAIEGVAADITYLKENLPATGGMTEAEVEELATKLEDAAAKSQAAADSLKALDAATDSDGDDEPVEPTE